MGPSGEDFREPLPLIRNATPNVGVAEIIIYERQCFAVAVSGRHLSASSNAIAMILRLSGPLDPFMYCAEGIRPSRMTTDD
jgi:hypothetical protein